LYDRHITVRNEETLHLRKAVADAIHALLELGTLVILRQTLKHCAAEGSLFRDNGDSTCFSLRVIIAWLKVSKLLLKTLPADEILTFPRHCIDGMLICARAVRYAVEIIARVDQVYTCRNHR
jgi:hypothetical protein